MGFQFTTLDCLPIYGARTGRFDVQLTYLLDGFTKSQSRDLVSHIPVTRDGLRFEYTQVEALLRAH